MFKIKTLNNISPVGLNYLPRDHYEVSGDINDPIAILLRSFNLHDAEIPSSVIAVGRAGAGVNNIPIDKCSANGVAVFNTPGANANAVKELVIAGMFLASRNICQGWHYSNQLEGDDDTIHKNVEKGKKQFVGFELAGRTLGIIGLGAIGVKVANAAIGLGMEVIGFDPGIKIMHAWELDRSVKKAISVDEVVAKADFLTLHVPLIDSTRNLISTSRLQMMKPRSVLLNFARDGIVDEAAVAQELKEDKLHAYVTDFPSRELLNNKRVINLPHLGASTKEAEQNCAVMIAKQVRDYLENGNIVNSVNFPETVMPRDSSPRVAIVNQNVPNMVAQISTVLGDANLNIVDMLNKSKAELAYTLIDVDKQIPNTVLDTLKQINGILMVRAL